MPWGPPRSRRCAHSTAPKGVVLVMDEVVQVGPAAVAPVHEVVPVNPQMYVETRVTRVGALTGNEPRTPDAGVTWHLR